MFVGKAGAYPNGKPYVSPILGKLQALPTNIAMLERPARGKHSSLFRTFANYGHKRIDNAGPACYEVNNLFFIQIIVYISQKVFFVPLITL